MKREWLFLTSKRIILSCLVFLCIVFLQRKCDGAAASPSKLDAFEVKRGTVKFLMNWNYVVIENSMLNSRKFPWKDELMLQKDMNGWDIVNTQIKGHWLFFLQCLWPLKVCFPCKKRPMKCETKHILSNAKNVFSLQRLGQAQMCMHMTLPPTLPFWYF